MLRGKELKGESGENLQAVISQGPLSQVEDAKRHVEFTGQGGDKAALSATRRAMK